MAQAQKGFSRYLPHGIIIAIFIVISCVFCYPAFQGKVMNQHDMFTWLYMSKESRDHYAQTGESTLWANNMFSGMPQNLTDFYPEGNWYHKLNQFIQFYTHGEVPNPASFFFLAMVSFYVLALALRINKWLGLLGAVAFAFSTYNPIIISAGHTTKMLDIAFLPGILAGVFLAYRGRYWAGAAVAGLFLAFAFDAGHYQIIYYGGITVGVLIIAKLEKAIRKKAVKPWLFASGTLLLAAAFAMLTNASRLLLVQEYNPYTIRGGAGELKSPEEAGSGLDKDYAFAWSNGIGETFCLLVPDLYGGASSEDIGTDSHMGERLRAIGVQPQGVEQLTRNAPMYWGPQPMLSGPVYFGAVICLLTVLSLLVIRSPMKWWLGGISLFFILISLGSSFPAFNYFLFDYFPLLNKFRAPSMALSVPSLLFPILSIWALNDIFREKVSREMLLKQLKVAVGIVGGLCVLILLSVYFVLDFQGASDTQMAAQFGQMLQNEDLGRSLMNALREDRQSVAGSDAFRSLVFVALAAAVLWGFAKSKINKQTAVGALGLLIATDLIPVAARYLNEDNFLDEQTYTMQFQPRPADLQIMKDPDPYYRVFDLTGGSGPFNDAKPSYFHNAIGGYHGAKMQIYQELIERQISRFNAPVLNMLNTKYLIVPGNGGQAMVQQNPGALGNAWFVSEIEWAATADAAMNALNGPSLQNPADSSAGRFNPAETVVLREDLKADLADYTFGKTPDAGIRLTSYGPDELKFESSNAQDGLAVFSDIYYPVGWTATIDGKPVEIYRANYVLRALKVPAGKHEIVFSFASPAFEQGAGLALAGSVLLTLLIGMGIWQTWRRAKAGNEDDPVPAPESPNSKPAGPKSAKKKKGK